MATIEVDIQVENLTEVMATYDQIKLYRDTDPAGSFSTLCDTETLVAGTNDYTLSDTTGSAAYIYRHLFYNSVTLVQSSLSAAYFPTGRLAQDIILEAAKKTKGFVGACTAAGTTTTLVDSYLAENGLDEDYLDGSWTYRPDAAAEGDWMRRTVHNPFNPTASSLEIVVPWTNAPASGERYGVFQLLPPLPGRGGYSYLEALSDGVAALVVPDTIDVGTGTTTGKNRFSLNAHVGYLEKNDVKKVRLRQYTVTGDLTFYEEEDASKNQRWWEYSENGRDDVAVRLFPPPTTDEHVMVELHRKFERFYRPDDLTLCPFDLAVWACVAKVYEHLGKGYAAELANAQANLNLERTHTRPIGAVKQ